MKVKFEGLSGVELDVKHLTVMYGTGEFQDNDGEVYNIYNIILPMLGDGKHVSVHSKDIEDVTEWRSYDDGKILSFTCEKVEHWNVD